VRAGGPGRSVAGTPDGTQTSGSRCHARPRLRARSGHRCELLSSVRLPCAGEATARVWAWPAEGVRDVRQLRPLVRWLVKRRPSGERLFLRGQSDRFIPRAPPSLVRPPTRPRQRRFPYDPEHEHRRQDRVGAADSAP
jgi:hypothetical protein